MDAWNARTTFTTTILHGAFCDALCFLFYTMGCVFVFCLWNKNWILYILLRCDDKWTSRKLIRFLIDDDLCFWPVYIGRSMYLIRCVMMVCDQNDEYDVFLTAIFYCINSLLKHFASEKKNVSNKNDWNVSFVCKNMVEQFSYSLCYLLFACKCDIR